ncbi:MAG TPA: hypothetical protein VFE58_04185 [Tepidisphaeraceae bacterium]|jgi:hypothetical protein|nr:hypothetical protein [Tepidisphaeraceae bacterium]
MAATEKEAGTGREGPDTDAVYGRDDPAKESGQGRLDNNKAIPERRADKPEQAVPQRQGLRQINAEDEVHREGTRMAREPLEVDMDRAEQPDHSLLDEEPQGEDLMPTDIRDPRQRRHPRTEGKGGTR